MESNDLIIPSHWDCKPLVDCTSNKNISYGIVQPGQHDKSGIGIIRVNNFENGELNTSDVLKVTPSIESKFAKTRLSGGEVLLTLVGSTGQSAVVPNELKGWNVARAVAVIKPSGEVTAEWLNICLQSSHTRNFLDARANTTVQKTLNLKDVKDIPIPLPPKDERDELERIAVNLNKKITLNRQINHTLEQMAQALFKSWFVDFDPVVDNALDAGFFEQNLGFPDELLRRVEARKAVRESADFKPLPEDIRQLFPASFEECAESTFGLGGWVPRGWAVKCVSEAISINPKVSLAKNAIAKFVDMKALPTTGYSIEEVIEKPFTGGMKFKQDDVLVARITPCLQNGKTGIVDFLSDKEAGFGSTEFIILRGNKNIHYSYIACLARHEQFRQHVMQSMVGSSGRQRVQNGCFDNYQIAVPPIEVMNSFASLVLPSFKKLKQNTNESISLNRLRDTLLPKLISGELRLSDSEVETAEDVLA